MVHEMILSKETLAATLKPHSACKMCGVKLQTEEEKELGICTKHLNEIDRMAYGSR